MFEVFGPSITGVNVMFQCVSCSSECEKGVLMQVAVSSHPAAVTEEFVKLTPMFD
jgi:hypothetical protein